MALREDGNKQIPFVITGKPDLEGDKSLAVKLSLPRYDLLASNDQKRLSKMVSEHLGRGWELYGDPGVAVGSDGKTTYIQAVIFRLSSD